MSPADLRERLAAIVAELIDILDELDGDSDLEAGCDVDCVPASDDEPIFTTTGRAP